MRDSTVYYSQKFTKSIKVWIHIFWNGLTFKTETHCDILYYPTNRK